MGYYTNKLRTAANNAIAKRTRPFDFTTNNLFTNRMANNWIHLRDDKAIDIANETCALTIDTNAIFCKTTDIILNTYGFFLQADPNMVFISGRHLKKSVLEGDKFLTKKSMPQYVITGVPLEGQKSVEISELLEQKQIFEDPNTEILRKRLDEIVKEIEDWA